MKQENITPERDASLGLVYRLNNLWADVDGFSRTGRYDEWNNTLDAVYRNLLYRNDIEEERDEKTGRIIKARLPKKDVERFRYFSIEIYKAKKNYRLARTRLERNKNRSRWYHSVQNKDVWLRKLMYQNRLYLKETEKKPGTSVYGTFRGGR